MLRILIADDHAIIRRGLREILSESYPSASFGEVGDAATAVQQIVEQEWDLLICDLSMPDRSGMDVLHFVQQHRPGLPILVLSIYPEEQYAVRVLKAGALGYLTKDSATDELVKAVERLLQGRRYVSAALAEKLAAELNRPFLGSLTNYLSEREFQVFLLLAQGRSISDIAVELSLSNTTVSTYRARILDKMGLKSNADLVRYGIDNKLI